ncbi:hypothetical protein [Streptomyces sp. NPDC008121]|uniref:hypothetical protein n=1 Tax=Streptomyces sp. NPDC008121 TaxID=3364809 RepID=UPI0036E63F0B
MSRTSTKIISVLAGVTLLGGIGVGSAVADTPVSSSRAPATAQDATMSPLSPDPAAKGQAQSLRDLLTLAEKAIANSQYKSSTALASSVGFTGHEQGARSTDDLKVWDFTFTHPGSVNPFAAVTATVHPATGEVVLRQGMPALGQVSQLPEMTPEQALDLAREKFPSLSRFDAVRLSNDIFFDSPMQGHPHYTIMPFDTGPSIYVDTVTGKVAQSG